MFINFCSRPYNKYKKTKCSNLLIDERAAVILGELGGVGQYVLVEALIEDVELRGLSTPHVEPPVAGQPCLREYGSIRAEERRLPTVEVAVVPHLTM